MNDRFTGTERFQPARHDVSDFGSGNNVLDRWLVQYAGQNERRDAARTFVAAHEHAVYGFYTLIAGQLEHAEATRETRKGLSRHYPVPVAIVARLAVDVRYQGHGIGASLLDDALSRVLRASGEVAVRAVVVHAIDDRAASFYGRFGFRPLGATPRTLMTTLATLRAAGYQ